MENSGGERRNRTSTPRGQFAFETILDPVQFTLQMTGATLRYFVVRSRRVERKDFILKRRPTGGFLPPPLHLSVNSGSQRSISHADPSSCEMHWRREEESNLNRHCVPIESLSRRPCLQDKSPSRYRYVTTNTYVKLHTKYNRVFDVLHLSAMLKHSSISSYTRLIATVGSPPDCPHEDTSAS